MAIFLFILAEYTPLLILTFVAKIPDDVIGPMALLLILLLAILPIIIYFMILPASSFGGTFGMRIMKFKIYNEDLTQAGFWKILGKYVNFCWFNYFSGGLLGLVIGWTLSTNKVYTI